MAAEVQAILDLADRYAPNPDKLRDCADDVDVLLKTATDPHPILIAAVLGYGTFMRRVAMAQPHVVSRETWDQLHDGPDAVLAPLDSPIADDQFQQVLRRRRNATWTKIALAQALGIWQPEQVWSSLSHATDLFVRQATKFCENEANRRFGTLVHEGREESWVLLAFGKQGVFELNFSSDIDIVFVCSDAKGTTTGGEDGSIDGAKYFRRLATRLMAVLQDLTEDGFVFRVDVRLRPNGTRGVLVPNIDSVVDYYFEGGSSWERIALLRARPIAGDLALGHRLLQALEGYIFPRHLDFESIEAMRVIKEKLNREALRKSVDRIDLKHGKGGIRELEFLVQNLQIIFGGRRPGLRVRSTLGAIEGLTQAGIIAAEIGRDLARAYTFLRHVENTVQARDDRQTYLLPTDDGLAEIARAAGFGGETPGADLLAELNLHRQCVEKEFAALYQEQGSDEATVAPEVFDYLENESLRPDERTTMLTEIGFEDTAEAARTIERLVEGPKQSVYGTRSREQFQQILPMLLHAVFKSAFPDQALRLLFDFTHRIGGRSYLYALLRENPHVIQSLIATFSNSMYLSRLFTRNPQLLDLLVLKSHISPMRERRGFDGIVATSIAETDTDSDDIEPVANALRLVKQQEILRIGFHDLAHDIDVSAVQTQLSDMAESLLDATRKAAFEYLARRFGIDPSLQEHLVAIALGKLGSRELNYGSDLDLLFMSADPEALPMEMAIRGAQKILSLMHTRTREGMLYEIDMQLRPSGNQGLLVTNIDAFAAYQRDQAAIWERVAFVKARILGSHSANDRIREIIDQTCFERGLTAADIDEMERIRTKMETERGASAPLKTGVGGTSDIEIAIALVQLAWGHPFPEICRRAPEASLAAWTALPQPFPTLATPLHDALREYRLLESRLHLLLDRPAAALPDNEEQLALLASGLGFESSAAFVAHRQQSSKRVREVYQEVLQQLRRNPGTNAA